MQFLVLPDSAAGARVAESVRPAAGGRVIAHPSGRPWVVGAWRSDEVVTATAGTRSLVLLGSSTATAAGLLAELDRLSGLRDLDAVPGRIAGSYHLLASFDGRLRAQGTISAARQVFRTRAGGTTVLADRPQALAALVGAGLDEAHVARHLMAPSAPWPLADRPAWTGVVRVEPDSHVVVDPDGTHTTTRWWTPPAAELPLREGAERVRGALRAAVAARAHGPGRTSADLSGGMDSTSLSFLLAERNPDLVTTRLEAVDPANDDARWAARAALDLPEADHVVIPRGEAPLNFTGALDPDPDAEGPFAWLRTKGVLAHHARLLADKGVTRHLTGHGGDELFYVMPAHDHSAVRVDPLGYLPHLRPNRSLRRWSLGQALRFLADGTGYASWLDAASRTLTAGLGHTSHPSMGWGEPPRLPAWATPRAVEANRVLLREAAAAAPEPLSPLRAQHATLDMARTCGDGLRRATRVTERHGVSWHAPFVDDHVVEAALSIRLRDRAEANRYKPVLAAAMRGSVPDHVLGRPTKGEFSADVYAGLDHHKRELLAQCADLELERLGLVDGDAFRRALVTPHPAARTLIPVITTLACESWLRSAAAARTSTPLSATSGGAR